MEAKGDLAIGIDLGTTYSCVGVWQNDKVVIISNTGYRTTPSIVAYTPQGQLVGRPARGQAARNPKNTIYDAKRLIGRSPDDPSIKEDQKFWPFKVVNDGGKCAVQVESQGETIKVQPEAISAAVLRQLREAAETYLGTKVKKAVITVPAYFNDAQRQATKNAGIIAGLTVERIINEPTAAALAYGVQEQRTEDETLLVFDLGGGTFDVSIVSLSDNTFEVLATKGDTHLGGEDFDQNLMALCLEKWKQQFGEEPPEDVRSRRRLKMACQTAKEELSETLSATIDLEASFNQEDFSCTISRAEFERVNREPFERCITIVEAALNDARLQKSKIDKVLLVGGSSYIPRIRELLADFFGGKDKLYTKINPDEAIAYGAAIQAANLYLPKSQKNGTKLAGLTLLDVTPLDLGIETVGDLFSPIIKRNSTVPCRNTQTYVTVNDDQTSIKVAIYQGERARTTDTGMFFLGQFTVSGLPPRKAGEAKVNVTFELDVNSILHAKAVAQHDASVAASMKVDMTKANSMSKEELEKAWKDCQKYKAIDKKIRERVEALNELEQRIGSIEYDISKGIAKSSEELSSALSRARGWVNTNRKSNDVSVEAIRQQKEKVEEAYSRAQSGRAPPVSRSSGGGGSGFSSSRGGRGGKKGDDEEFNGFNSDDEFELD